jgi:hypothetical protein
MIGLLAKKELEKLWIESVVIWSTRQSSWLRHYATVRKVADSIPYEVIGFLN